MKKIHFEDNKGNRLLRLAIIIGAAFSVIGMFLEFPRNIVLTIAVLDLIAACFEAATMPQIRYKNFIQQDKFGVYLKINSMWVKRISFKDILLTELKEDVLILKNKYGKKKHINLKGFEEADIYRIYEIFLLNTKGNFQAKLQTR